LLGLFVLVGIVVTWFFARRAALAYRTEQHALELARKALASRDELMGLVAHDLRNPLGAISLKAALLRATANVSAAVQREAESIENIALRMRFLIGSMLDVTTIEAGCFTVAPDTCAVDDILHEACDLFTDAAALKAVRFSPPTESTALLVHA